MKQRLLIPFLIMMLLAACGTSTTTAPAAQSTPVAAVEATTAPIASEAAAATAEAAPPTAEAAAVQATSAPVPTADIGPAPTSCAEGQRLFEHELLITVPVCIPNAPQRVITLDIGSLEMMLMLGQKPVATAQWILDELPILEPQYAEALKGMPGMDYPANLEAVAALKPDLILAPADTIDVALGSKIAPIVTPNDIVNSDWKANANFWSAALNVPDFYINMEANYKTRIDELHAALGQSRPTVSVISTGSYGISMWMPDSAPGVVLGDAGLPRPEAQAVVGDTSVAKYGSKQYVEVSLERLDLVDADTIFYFNYAAVDPTIAQSESAAVKAFEQQPVWQALSAVKAKKAFLVPGHWWRSQTYVMANLVLDDLFTHLANSKATTPALTGP